MSSDLFRGVSRRVPTPDVPKLQDARVVRSDATGVYATPVGSPASIRKKLVGATYYDASGALRRIPLGVRCVIWDGPGATWLLNWDRPGTPS